MADSKTNTYEGLFLFPQSAVVDLQGAHDHLMELLNRVSADIISFSKWDERRLAYEIKGNKRGVYFLVYFRADPQNVQRLERDCNLSEKVLRSLVTRADLIPEENMKATEGRDTLADEIKLRKTEAAEKPAAPAPAEEPAAAAAASSDE